MSSIPIPFASSGPGPGRMCRCWPITEHPDHEHLARVWCFKRQEREHQSRAVEVGLGSGDGDPFDLPPAYTAIDTESSPLRLRGVNGDPGISGE